MFRKEITSEEVKQMMESYCQNEGDEISFQQFVPLMAPVFKLNDRYVLCGISSFSIDSLS